MLQEAIAEIAVAFRTTLLLTALPVTIGVAVYLARGESHRKMPVIRSLKVSSIALVVMVILFGELRLLLAGCLGIGVGFAVGGLIGMAWRAEYS